MIWITILDVVMLLLMAEWWSRLADSRVRGYMAAGIFAVIMVVFCSLVVSYGIR